MPGGIGTSAGQQMQGLGGGMVGGGGSSRPRQGMANRSGGGSTGRRGTQRRTSTSRTGTSRRSGSAMGSQQRSAGGGAQQGMPRAQEQANAFFNPYRSQQKEMSDWKGFWEAQPQGRAQSEGMGFFNFWNPQDVVNKAYGQGRFDLSQATPMYDQYGIYGYEFY